MDRDRWLQCAFKVWWAWQEVSNCYPRGEIKHIADIATYQGTAGLWKAILEFDIIGMLPKESWFEQTRRRGV